MDKISVLMTMIPTLPLVAALLCALAGPRLLRQYCHVPVILCLAGSFVGSFLLFLEVRSIQSAAAEHAPSVAGFERVVTLWSWANVEDALTTRERRRRTMVSAPAVTFASISYGAPMR